MGRIVSTCGPEELYLDKLKGNATGDKGARRRFLRGLYHGPDSIYPWSGWMPTCFPQGDFVSIGFRLKRSSRAGRVSYFGPDIIYPRAGQTLP